MKKINRIFLLIHTVMLVLVFSQLDTHAQAKGMDVTEVRIAKTAIAPEVIYRNADGKSWQVIANGQVTQTCNETGRDEWSVYLACAEVRVVLDLFKKERSIIGNAGSTITSPIQSSSNAPVVASQPAPAVSTAKRSATSNAELPLSTNEMAQVMKWISVKTSAKRLPFCWRQNYTNTAGKPMICQAGYDETSPGICSAKCKADEKGIATFCYKNCPAGFRDDGLYCAKPEAYGRGAGYVVWEKEKCEKENPQGCEQVGAIHYPKCKAGFTPAGSNICSPSCPQGWEDIGVSCKKPNTFRDTKPLTACAAGLDKGPADQLCYPTCKPDFEMRGPVCWQKCPSQQNIDCGAGCATSSGECTDAVFSMVSTPIKAALQIAILVMSGGGSAAESGASNAAKNMAKATEVLEQLKDLVDVAEEIKNLVQNQSAQEFFNSFDTNPTNKAKFEKYSQEFVENFSEMTSNEVEREIDKKFSPKAAAEIKRQWSYNHLSMMLEANGMSTAKGVVSVIAAADPTGIADVVKAFTNPVCKDNTPFPTVNPKY